MPVLVEVTEDICGISFSGHFDASFLLDRYLSGLVSFGLRNPAVTGICADGFMTLSPNQ